MEINWIKVSEILFDAVLTGLISAAVVIITFKLGKRQSDVNWKREIERREKERISEENKDTLKRQLVCIDDLLSWKEMIRHRLSDEYLNTHLFDGNEINRINADVRRAKGLYQFTSNPKISHAINQLGEITSWDSQIKPKEEVIRMMVFDNIFDTLEGEFQALERDIGNIPFHRID